MKKLFLVLCSVVFLIGCASDQSNQEKEVNQTPRFGKPDTTIPWNQPTDWEKNGQLGSMPGFEGSH